MPSFFKKKLSNKIIKITILQENLFHRGSLVFGHDDFLCDQCEFYLAFKSG